MSRELRDGDECPSCTDHWSNQPGKSRPRLVQVGSTVNKKLRVLACPFCDGQRLIDIFNARK